MYSAAVEQRFRNPRWSAAAGAQPPDAQWAVGHADTPGSAAVLELLLVIEDGRVRQAMFKVYGCPSCIAAADWACEWLTGRSRAQARALTAAHIEAALDLAPAKRHCGLLVEDALAAALAQD